MQGRVHKKGIGFRGTDGAAMHQVQAIDLINFRGIAGVALRTIPSKVLSNLRDQFD